MRRTSGLSINQRLSGGDGRGICLGWSLSPLMGAIYLLPLDQALQESGLDYVRYMDDWIVMAPTRWRLRRAISITNRVLECLKIRQHPDKTFIGRIAATFTFLGFTFSESGIVSVAIATMAKFVARCHRLYERNVPQRRVGDYRRRWLSWVRSVLPPASVESATDDKCEQAERPDQPCLRLGYRSTAYLICKGKVVEIKSENTAVVVPHQDRNDVNGITLES